MTKVEPNPQSVAPAPPPRRNLWPVGILVAFALFVPATAGLVVLALAHRHELTRPDYYEQELRHQREMDSRARARALGSAASIAFDASGPRLTVTLPADHARRGVVGRVGFYRPSAAGLDRELPLAPASNGLQRLDLPDLRPGLWKVRVVWVVDGQDYLLEANLTNLAAVARSTGAR